MALSVLADSLLLAAAAACAERGRGTSGAHIDGAAGGNIAGDR